MTWFNKQSRLVQILLLLIPFVNWITEIVCRWTTFLKTRNIVSLIMAIIATVGGGFILGWLDLIWVILYGKFFLQ